jgi:hypothetical protein
VIAGEAQALADGARNAVAATTCTGALTLGAVVTVATTTALADVTGIFLASVLAGIGLFILPARRKKAREELRQKIVDMRERLSTALRDQFLREIQRSGDRIRESIAPAAASSARKARSCARSSRSWRVCARVERMAA